ncbi:MAG TPA: helix-turn-helix domain-containing protein [Solirubrobacterales bacterium]|nr:helix-turn-helix domain-containing protein [Solirubrobacterales bacterium]
MRISTTPNATPQSTPPSSAGSRGGRDDDAGGEQAIWRTLVPRLVHPARLQIVEALISNGGPMSAVELAPLVPQAEGNADLVRYHAKAMTEVGALEVVDTRRAEGEAGPQEPAFYFALPQ